MVLQGSGRDALQSYLVGPRIRLGTFCMQNMYSITQLIILITHHSSSLALSGEITLWDLNLLMQLHSQSLFPTEPNQVLCVTSLYHMVMGGLHQLTKVHFVTEAFRNYDRTCQVLTCPQSISV